MIRARHLIPSHPSTSISTPISHPSSLSSRLIVDVKLTTDYLHHFMDANSTRLATRLLWSLDTSLRLAQQERNEFEKE